MRAILPVLLTLAAHAFPHQLFLDDLVAFKDDVTDLYATSWNALKPFCDELGEIQSRRIKRKISHKLQITPEESKVHSFMNTVVWPLMMNFAALDGSMGDVERPLNELRSEPSVQTMGFLVGGLHGFIQSGITFLYAARAHVDGIFLAGPQSPSLLTTGVAHIAQLLPILDQLLPQWQQVEKQMILLANHIEEECHVRVFQQGGIVTLQPLIPLNIV